VEKGMANHFSILALTYLGSLVLLFYFKKFYFIRHIP